MVSCNLIAGQEYNLKVLGYNKNTSGAFTITVSYGKMIQTDTPIYENLSTSDDQWYVFTAPVSGFYRFYNFDSNANTRGELYQGNTLLASDDYLYSNTFSFGYALQSGQEYLFKVVFPSTSAPAQKKYTLVLTEYVSLDGTSHAYDNVEPDLEYWYCLTPDTTSEYSFIAYSSVEITASLYEGTTQVAGPVSGLSGSQEGFSINATLTAGKTYHLKITGGNLAGRFTLYASGAADRNPLTLYETQERYLDTTSVHWYKFTPAETRNYRFFTDGSAKTKVELYQGSNLVGTYYDYSNATSPWNKINIERELTAGLEYRLRVSCYGGEVGSYQLTVHDYIELAEDVSLNSYLDSNKECWFKFNPFYEGVYWIYTEGSLDTIGYLYRGSTVITEDDDVGNANWNFRISSQLSYDDTYFIKVIVNPASIHEKSGNFSITAVDKIFPKGDFFVRSLKNCTYLTVKKNEIDVFTDEFFSNVYQEEQLPPEMQIWNFEPSGDQYHIRSTYPFSSDRYLQYDNSGSALAKIDSYNNIDWDQKAFRVVRNSPGSYSILAISNNDILALTLEDNGEIRFTHFDESINQQWALERTNIYLGGMRDFYDEKIGKRRDFSELVDESFINSAELLGADEVIKFTEATPYELIDIISNSYFFCISAHGFIDGLYVYSTNNYDYDPTNPNTGDEYFTVEMLEDLPDNYFDGTCCVLLNACSTAEGGALDPNNLVNALNRKGVKVVVGFKEPTAFLSTDDGINTYEMDGLWCRVFLETLANTGTVNWACELATNAIDKKDYNVVDENNNPLDPMLGFNTWYVAGNGSNVVRRNASLIL